MYVCINACAYVYLQEAAHLSTYSAHLERFQSLLNKFEPDKKIKKTAQLLENIYFVLVYVINNVHSRACFNPPPLYHPICLCLKSVLQDHINHFTYYRSVSKQIKQFKSVLQRYMYIHPTLVVSIICLTEETRVYYWLTFFIIIV